MFVVVVVVALSSSNALFSVLFGAPPAALQKRARGNTHHSPLSVVFSGVLSRVPLLLLLLFVPLGW